MKDCDDQIGGHQLASMDVPIDLIFVENDCKDEHLSSDALICPESSNLHCRVIKSTLGFFIVNTGNSNNSLHRMGKSHSRSTSPTSWHGGRARFPFCLVVLFLSYSINHSRRKAMILLRLARTIIIRRGATAVPRSNNSV
jgi:hypothetical protein